MESDLYEHCVHCVDGTSCDVQHEVPCIECPESGYEPFMGCLFHGRGQAGDPCTCGPVGPVDKSEDPESSFDGPLLGDVFDEGESEGGSAEAKPASPSPSLGPDLKTCAVGEVTITQRVEAHRVDREDRYGVDRNEHEPSFACSESEFENRAAGVTAHLRATHAERENAEMTAWVQRWAPIIEAAKDVSLDHSCGLDGWDEACPECRFAKLMYEEAKR